MSGSRFAGRVALVTGASRGIGLATAQRIVGEGGRVCVTGRDPLSLAEAVDALGGAANAMMMAGSTDDEQHRQETVEAVIATWGRLDVLVNNTGMNTEFGSVLDVPPARFARIMGVNVVSALGWVALAHRAWLDQHGGVVVNVASVAGLRPAHGIGAYGASKAALMHLTQQLAVELSPGVRVNAVAPAIVRTRFAGPLFDGKEEKLVAGYPLGRLGVPEDVAAAVAYLASDDAAWVTGQVLTLDGGLTLAGGV